MKRVFIYDLETLDLFTATFLDKDSDYKRVFVISNTKDERKELFEFLDKEVAKLVGYNCLFFDAQIIEYLYRNPDATALQIRTYAQIITSSEDRRPDVPEWKLRIPHLDLFKALSLSTKAKRAGLKWCEYQMDLDNIEDMPSQGEGDNWKEMVLSYNLNDVIATKELFKRYYYEIDLRKYLTKREGINLLNCTEPDLSKRLFGKYLSNAMRIPLNDLRSKYTERDIVLVKDILLPYIEFKTEHFNLVKKSFESLAVTKRDSFEFISTYQGVEIVYGLGGIHAAVNNKKIESNEEKVIKSLDVVSFYPNLIIKNKLCPAHLPKDIFLKLYEGLFIERQSIPKSDPRNYILKILLNSTYGLTNDEYSFLRDREVTLSICINGQLLLTMLLEDLTTQIPECQMLMMNTDGFEVILPRKYEEQYYTICKTWEEKTQLQLEFVDYQKMIIWDVNNYIGLYSNGKYKTKGRFEFENIPLHKNKSHNIIPIAIFNYFTKNIPIEETIKTHTNIFDFCAGVRAKKSEKSGMSHYELHSIEDGVLAKQRLSKTVRYYISTVGKYLMKVYEDGSIEHVEAPMKINKSRTKDWKVTYFNKKFDKPDFKDYNIDYSYYISKARKLISEIEVQQQKELIFN